LTYQNNIVNIINIINNSLPIVSRTENIHDDSNEWKITMYGESKKYYPCLQCLINACLINMPFAVALLSNHCFVIAAVFEEIYVTWWKKESPVPVSPETILVHSMIRAISVWPNM